MMRAFDRKDVFSWANCEGAREYIGKDGYFGDSLEELQSWIQAKEKQKLLRIDSNSAISFTFNDLSSGSFRYGLFLPADKVKEIKEEKKYRPFETIAELFTTLIVSYGDTIRFRQKENPDIVQVGILNGYCEEKGKLDHITIGGWILEVQQLFRNFEIYDSKTKDWIPFGIAE